MLKAVVGSIDDRTAAQTFAAIVFRRNAFPNVSLHFLIQQEMKMTKTILAAA
jgi:hypothetical protein